VDERAVEQEGAGVTCQRVLPDALPAGEVVEASYHLDLDPLPRLVGEARRFITVHAPPLPDETLDALLLLTSELVTNAVLHARTQIEVGITIARHSVLVTVHDLDLTRVEQHPYEHREGGWGLGLVAALAEASALQTHADGGKTAWFRLPRGAAAAVDDDAAARVEHGAAGGTGAMA
jgi:Histidine kinase-like ATPase domain